MEEAETAIDQLVTVVDKGKAESAKHQKSFADMKSYADELETAFNGLHGRYTKLKEYYTASDANQQARTLAVPCGHLGSRCGVASVFSLAMLWGVGRARACAALGQAERRKTAVVCTAHGGWQVLSKNLLEANALIKSHQEQLKVAACGHARPRTRHHSTPAPCPAAPLCGRASLTHAAAAAPDGGRQGQGARRPADDGAREPQDRDIAAVEQTGTR